MWKVDKVRANQVSMLLHHSRNRQIVVSGLLDHQNQ